MQETTTAAVSEVQNPTAPVYEAPPHVPSVQRKRRFGDRKDGRKLRTLSPMTRVAAFLMKNRIGASNYIRDSVEITQMERYIRKMRADGFTNFGALHVFLATFVRTVSQKPGLNRFLSGQTVYARPNVEIALTIKKEMSVNSPDTVIKITVDKDATAEEVYLTLNNRIEEEKRAAELGSSFDKTARILNYIPRLLLRFAVGFLKFLDYFGWLPRSLMSLSPFHGSIVITSMGSLGIPPIYHHLYDFGNIPVFWAFGAKRTAYELDRDGKPVERKYIDYTVVTDERTCDGFYYASGLKYARMILRNPFVLSKRPDSIVEDID